MDFKAIAWIAVGLVLGFALGGVPVRRQLESLDQEHETLKRRLKNQQRPNPLRALLPQLGGGAVLPMPVRAVAVPVTTDAGVLGESVPPGDVAERPEAQGTTVVIGAGAAASDQAATAARGRTPSGELTVITPDSPADGSRRRLRPSGREALRQFDRMAAVQRARVAASRSALIAQANLSDEQVAQLDTSVERMNNKLAGYGEEVIDQMATDEPPKPAAALSLGHDVSGILHEGQTEIDGIVGVVAEDVDPSAMEIWNYVDIEQWRPFVDSRLAGEPAAEGSDAPPAEEAPPSEPAP